MNKLIFLLITVFAIFAEAQGSFGVRGGGNTCVEHFISYGKVIHNSIKEIQFDSDRFLEKLNIADIVEVQSEMVNYEGNQYIAMNEPSANRIYLSQKWCRESRLGLPENRSALIVFHEILGLSEPGRDKNYELSRNLYTDTGLTEEDFYYLALTGGQDRHVFQTYTYTWVRINAGDSRRFMLRTSGNKTNEMISIDCAPPGKDAVMIILGQSNRYKFANQNMCYNLMEFLAFRHFTEFKVSFLIGTTTHTVYDVITE